MTYYNSQIIYFNTICYSNTYLIKQVIQAKHFIDNNYSDNISLDHICKAVFISKFHLIRSFKKLYGRTPNQHLTSVRIEKAKQLLRANVPVLEVCHTVGYDSPTTFAALFRKMAGAPPHIFQRAKK